MERKKERKKEWEMERKKERKKEWERAGSLSSSFMPAMFSQFSQFHPVKHNHIHTFTRLSMHSICQTCLQTLSHFTSHSHTHPHTHTHTHIHTHTHFLGNVMS